ncbi:MAG: hypothetical protein KC619_05535 [Myxococcales bacterium]|nr:hypothetical protein [Myxococcales bacterium]
MGDTTTLFRALSQLRASWVARGWSWDRRFECVASTLIFEDGPRAMQLVSTALPERWTSKTLAQAPHAVQEVATATGGVRDDQILFASAEAPLIAYGLWWPWGGESTNISVRVGLAGRVGYEDQLTLRELFGTLED